MKTKGFEVKTNVPINQMSTVELSLLMFTFSLRLLLTFL